MNFQPLMIFGFWEKSFSLGLELDVKSEEFRKCVVNLSFKFSSIAKVFFQQKVILMKWVGKIAYLMHPLMSFSPALHNDSKNSWRTFSGFIFCDLLVPYAKLVDGLIYHLNTIKKTMASPQIINNSDCKSSYDIPFHFL